MGFSPTPPLDSRLRGNDGWVLRRPPKLWRILIWGWLYERANYAEMGTRGSGSVEGRDDLLLDALEGFDVASRDGAEHDLVDTGVNELADSIDYVI